jgi:glycosyltransferase involved in cell wall biosynthesis
LIFISKYNEKLFPNQKILSQQIFNPINPIFFDSHRYTTGTNSIVFVARLNKNKNLGLLIEALSKLVDENMVFDLHVVGRSKEGMDNNYEEYIKSKVDSNGLSKHVQFHGWMTQAELFDLYQECALFVLPSQQENLPVSIGEAMALGKVVIASDVGAISEMFIDKESGFLFEKNNVDQLTSILRTLHDNSELIETISSNAREEAIRKYHPDLVAKQTVDFYGNVLKNNSIQQA